MIETERNILMFYHTSLRNAGLYTSISLALLGYSRYYRGKNKIYDVAFIVLSLAILLCAITICIYLISDVEDMSKELETKYLDKWLTLPKSILLIDSLVGIFGTITLFKEIA